MRQGNTILEKIQVDIQEVRTLMERQDVRKAPRPDNVSNLIMTECSKQLEGKIKNIIVSSLKRVKFLSTEK